MHIATDIIIKAYECTGINLLKREPKAKNVVAITNPIPSSSYSIFLFSSFFSTISSWDFKSLPFPLKLGYFLPNLSKRPPQTIARAFPNATAGTIIANNSVGVCLKDSLKIWAKGIAPAPIPPPIIGIAIKKIAFKNP